MEVIVPDDQLSLAIGRKGLNVRLAARISGWKIDIHTESDYGEEATVELSPEEVFQREMAAMVAGEEADREKNAADTSGPSAEEGVESAPPEDDVNVDTEAEDTDEAQAGTAAVEADSE